MSDMTVGQGANWMSLEGEEFVRQAYQRLLERSPDLVGLHSYTAQLMAGLSKEQLVAELESSPEGRLVARRRGRSRAAIAMPAAAKPAPAFGSKEVSVQDLLAFDGEEFVLQAYRALLGREADPSGLQHYTQRLAQGERREQIIADLHCDPEGQAYAAPIAGLGQFQTQLARAPHTEPLAAVGVQRAVDLLRLHGAEFVKAAYRAILDREADPEGLANYLRILDNGYSRSCVLAALATSPEASARGSSLPGAREFVNAYRRGQATSWTGWYWRNVKGVESDLAPAREARRLKMPTNNNR